MIATLHRRQGAKGHHGTHLRTTSREHSVYRWVSTAPGMELGDISHEDMALRYGMPEKVFREYLLGEIKAEQDLLSLPWAILSVILYALVLLYHESVHTNHSVEAAIDFDITENANFAFSQPGVMGHKNYEDVNSFADFWSWMGKGFVPLTLQWEYPPSESSGLTIGNLSARDRRHYLWHNLILAPVKLSQESAEDIPCPNSLIGSVYGFKCTRSVDIDLDMQPVENQITQGVYQEDLSKTVWLHSAAEGRQILTQLEESRWLDQNTDRVKVSTMLYNPECDLLVTTHVHFLFSRAGRIWKKITHESMNLKPYGDPWTYVWDVCFYVQVTYLFICELVEFIRATCRRTGWKTAWEGFKEYIGVWNTVDWVFVVASYIVLVLWIVRVERLTGIQASLLRTPAQDCPSSECTAHFDAMFDEVEETGKFIVKLRIFGAILPMVIMLRMFKAFSSQPRLALVTETLRKAWTSLSHYLIVFVAIFGSYAAMGVAFFGTQSALFTTLDRAVSTLFLMMLGGFDFHAMEAIGRGYAFFFFFSFMFLIVLIMLSMLIAIIMDVYVEVKAISKSSESLFLEAKNTVRRGIQNWQKKRISLHKITPVLCVDDNKLLRMEHLLDSSNIYYVPGLSEAQAQRLLSEAARMWSFKHALAVKPGDIKKFVDDTFKALTPFVRFSAVAAKTALSEEDENRDPADRSRSGLMESGSDDETADWDKGPSPEAAGRTEISVDQLAMQVPLQTLLRAAEMKISMGDPRAGLGCRLPSWPGSKELLSQVVSTAQTICSDFLHRAAV